MNFDPSIIVIFGLTGDLAQRYLMPALYHLTKDGLLNDCRVLGVTRGTTTTDELFQKAQFSGKDSLDQPDPTVVSQLRQITEMYQMDLDDPAAYELLLQKLNNLEDESGRCLNRLYYLSIPPKAYRPVIKFMGQSGLNKSCHHQNAATRILVEKPFGYDLDSARQLIAEVDQDFKTEQVFRIDHYLTKLPVQQLIAQHFEQPEIFERLNNSTVASIEVLAKEKIGIEGRATFYDPLGALRDYQSHLLQILALVVMAKPMSQDSTAIHQAKQAALSQINTVSDPDTQALRGQYLGYRDEVQNPESTTETYASIRLDSQDPRWQGVEMLISTGKALDERRGEVIIKIRQPIEGQDQLIFEIQPPTNSHPSAYEKVLIDGLRGDQTLFVSSQEIIEGWRIVDPVVKKWHEGGDGLQTYDVGSNGPNWPQDAKI